MLVSNNSNALNSLQMRISPANSQTAETENIEDIINKFISGNMSVSDFLSKAKSHNIYINNIIQPSKNDDIKYITIQFTFEDQLYKMQCNAEAVKSSSDNTTVTTYTPEELQTYDFDFETISKYFDTVAKKGNAVLAYVINPDCGYNTAEELQKELKEHFNQVSEQTGNEQIVLLTDRDRTQGILPNVDNISDTVAGVTKDNNVNNQSDNEPAGPDTKISLYEKEGVKVVEKIDIDGKMLSKIIIEKDQEGGYTILETTYNYDKERLICEDSVYRKSVSDKLDDYKEYSKDLMASHTEYYNDGSKVVYTSSEGKEMKEFYDERNLLIERHVINNDKNSIREEHTRFKYDADRLVAEEKTLGNEDGTRKRIATDYSSGHVDEYFYNESGLLIEQSNYENDMLRDMFEQYPKVAKAFKFQVENKEHAPEVIKLKELFEQVIIKAKVIGNDEILEKALYYRELVESGKAGKKKTLKLLNDLNAVLDEKIAGASLKLGGTICSYNGKKVIESITENYNNDGSKTVVTNKNVNGQNVRTTERFNNRGQSLSKIVQEKQNNGIYVTKEESTYIYKNNKLNSTKTTAYSTDGSKIVTTAKTDGSKVEMTYDTSNKLVSEVHYEDEDVLYTKTINSENERETIETTYIDGSRVVEITGTDGSKIEENYNTDNNLISSVHKDENGNVIESVNVTYTANAQIATTTNADGLEIVVTTSVDGSKTVVTMNSDGTKLEEGYNSNDVKISEIYYETINGSFVKAEEFITSYANSIYGEILHQTFNNDGSVSSKTVTRNRYNGYDVDHYDVANDRAIHSEEFTSTGVKTNEITYTYDSDGISVTVIPADGSTKSTIHYSNQFGIQRQEYFVNVDGSYVLTECYEYTYSDDGQAECATRYQYENNKVVHSDKCTMEGVLLETTDYTYKADGVTKDRTVTYTYNSDGTLNTRVRKDFANNGEYTQFTYTASTGICIKRACYANGSMKNPGSDGDGYKAISGGYLSCSAGKVETRILYNIFRSKLNNRTSEYYLTGFSILTSMGGTYSAAFLGAAQTWKGRGDSKPYSMQSKASCNSTTYKVSQEGIYSDYISNRIRNAVTGDYGYEPDDIVGYHWSATSELSKKMASNTDLKNYVNNHLSQLVSGNLDGIRSFSFSASNDKDLYYAIHGVNVMGAELSGNTLKLKLLDIYDFDSDNMSVAKSSTKSNPNSAGAVLDGVGAAMITDGYFKPYYEVFEVEVTLTSAQIQQLRNAGIIQ